MKKLFMMLGDIWVAAAFAEAGAYDALVSINNPRIRYRKMALLRSARSC
jgi:hypothetical protein